MRDYINRLSRGKSIIDVPRIIYDEDKVAMNVYSDRITEGSFDFAATDDIKGMIYSDNPRVSVITKAFNGTQVHAKYMVNTSELEENDEIEGRFTIVSNAGEKEIIFSFQCVKENYDNGTAVKKENIVISTDVQYINADIADDSQMYTFMLEKTGVGSVDIFIKSDAGFIQPEKNHISTDDFTGDRLELEFLAVADKLHAGKNYGYIYIDTYRQHLRIAVEAFGSKEESRGDNSARREDKKALVLLTKEYLDFRMHHIKKEKWFSECTKIVDRIRGIKGPDVFYDLVWVQLLCMSGRDEEAEDLYEKLKKDILGRIDDNVELYCYFLYVSTLVIKSEEYTAEVEKQVRKFFENGYDTYRILWVLFYLNSDTESNRSIRLIRIKDIVNEGCNSPVMYLEAMNIINSQPSLLRVLNDFEIKVIAFGCRYQIISEKLAMQIADVAAREKTLDLRMPAILERLYEQYDKDEILTALVTHMVRLGLTGKECFPAYEKGVLRGLRITRLYEFYISSMEKNLDRQLPKIVLLYFAYDNTLGDYNKAFLYANIVTNKQVYKDVYENYKKNIGIFVYEQLKQGKINDYLIVLYKEFLGAEYIREDTGLFVGRLKYIHKLVVFDNVVTSVIVDNVQMKEPCRYELADNKAYIYTYTGECNITFECIDGNIRDNIDYEIETVFASEDYDTVWNEAGRYCEQDAGYLINNSYVMHRKGINNDNTLAIYKAVKRCDAVNREYKKKVNSWMIEYYSKYYISDDFWHEYPYIDTDDLSDTDARMLTEVLIDAGMYSQAYEITQKYGCKNTAPAKLLKMVDYILQNVTDTHNNIIDEITTDIFREHIYNEHVLSYMVQYFNGTNDEMYNVWKAAVNYGVNVTAMSERIIAQMMYTGVHTGRLTEVFADYYSKIPDMLIVKAYLSYNSQLYLIRQKKANDIVFKVIEECMQDGYGLPECCYVAWLKDISRNPAALADNDKKKEMVQDVFDELCAADKIYGFYKRFEGILNMPYNVIGITVIEYIADPMSKVDITYSLNDSRDKITQTMKSNEWGIYTCRFTLFYGDHINYCISINGNKEKCVTEDMYYEYKDVSPDMADGRFASINDCLDSRSQHDLATLKKLMRSYSVEEYVTKQMFRPMK